MSQQVVNANVAFCAHKKKGVKKHIHMGILTATTYCKKCGVVIEEKVK